MALDRALADRAALDGTVVQRLYRWRDHTLSLGANEAATRTWDRARLSSERIATVRRPTGGRGVWHDLDDLTYAVTAPLAAFGDLRTAYREIHRELAGALASRMAGVTIAAATRRPTLAPGACFDLAVGGEVLVDGRKVIGSAQALLGPALLQHGAIALADRSRRLSRLRIDHDTTDDGPDSAPLGSGEEIAHAIIAAWQLHGAEPIPHDIIRDAEARSVSYHPHFQDDSWTWRR